MNIQQFLIILRARLSLFVAALAFTVCGTVVVSLILPKSYTAAASVVVDAKGGDLIHTTGLALPPQMSPGFMATQVDIMGSQRVALKVVDKLHIADSPVAQEQFKDVTEGRGSTGSTTPICCSRSLTSSLRAKVPWSAGRPSANNPEIRRRRGQRLRRGRSTPPWR